MFRIASTPSPFAETIEFEKRVFTNRNLDMADIRLVGFDMDYTLAIYKETLKALTTRLALRALVEQQGYPPSVLEYDYDPRFAIRGLVIDRKTGNLIKKDAHHHVSRVVYGFEELSREQRRRAYPRGAVRVGNSRYVLVDTLFELPEAYLYARMVEAETKAKGAALRSTDFQRLYRDTRAAVDLAHRDGSLKRTVMAYPDRYIDRDFRLADALIQFRDAGKRLFLLTNSEAYYTQAVMSYLLDGVHPAYPSWRDYFDVVVVFARKPGFFKGREPFLELDESGNAKGPAQSLERGKVYQGGNLRDFERFTGYSGDEILYVGDHIYGDVLRSKKTAAWRTTMVVPELERELRHLRLVMESLRQRDALERERRSLDDHRLWMRLRLHRLTQVASANGDDAHELRRVEASQRAASDVVAAKLKGVQRDIDEHFNPHWGMLLKTGHEHSAFGAQIEDYACLYTSRVSNFATYSPLEYFRTPRDLLPHEHFDLFGLGPDPRLGS